MMGIIIKCLILCVIAVVHSSFAFVLEQKAEKGTNMSFPKRVAEKIEEDFLRKLGLTKSDVQKKQSLSIPFSPYVRNRFVEISGNNDVFLDAKNANQKSTPTVRMFSPVKFERSDGFRGILFDLKEERKQFENVSKVELAFTRHPGYNAHVVIISDFEDVTTVSTDEGYIADVTNIFKQQCCGQFIYFKVKLLTPGNNHHRRLRALSPMLAVFDQIPPNIIHHYHRRNRRHIRSSLQNLVAGRENATIDTVEDLNYCRVQRWKLDFQQDMGWNFVLSPDAYWANYCDGSCPSPFIESYWNTTNYSFIKNLYHVKKGYGDSTVPRACCTPIEFADQTILYQRADETTVMKRMKDMIVTRCACR